MDPVIRVATAFARAAVTLYTAQEALPTGTGRRTLRMTGPADRVRYAAGT